MARKKTPRTNVRNTLTEAEKKEIQNFKQNEESQKIRPIFLNPKSENQKKMCEYLLDDLVKMLIICGDAGTGKTYLATRYAAKMLAEGKIKRILITRPTITTGNDLGFLPGGVDSKLLPYMIPVVDIIKECVGIEQYKKLMENEVVEFTPLQYMRGRTLNDCVIIADEMQNSDVEQFKCLTTRLGTNCKLIITGDTGQNDLKNKMKSGLDDFIEKLYAKMDDMNKNNKPLENIKIISLGREDIQRSEIVKTVLSIYD